MPEQLNNEDIEFITQLNLDVSPEIAAWFRTGREAGQSMSYLKTRLLRAVALSGRDVQRNGQQVIVGGQHYADARDANAAATIAFALERCGKESSPELASLASEVLRYQRVESNGDIVLSSVYNELLTAAKRLAGSVLSQTE